MTTRRILALVAVATLALGAAAWRGRHHDHRRRWR